MTIKEVYEILNKMYPFRKQCVWDNSGVFYNSNKITEVNSVTICLDFDFKVLDFAIKNKSNLVICHHPIFENFKNKKFLNAVKKAKISYIAMHTNFDKSPIGMNYHLSKKLKWKKAELLKGTMIFTGILNKEILQKQYALHVKKVFDLKSVQLYSCNENKVKNVAIVGGSGMDAIEELKNSKIDLFLTGDVRWHAYRDAHSYGINILDIGHISEKIIIEVLEEILTKHEVKTYSFQPRDHKLNL